MVGWWKEDIKEHLKPSYMSIVDQAESEDLGDGLSISLAEVAMVVKKQNKVRAASFSTKLNTFPLAVGLCKPGLPFCHQFSF